jgi:hypothetical protein
MVPRATSKLGTRTRIVEVPVTIHHAEDEWQRSLRFFAKAVAILLAAVVVFVLLFIFAPILGWLILAATLVAGCAFAIHRARTQAAAVPVEPSSTPVTETKVNQ